MKSNRFSINRRVLFVLVIIALETIFIKALQYKILPAKYFYDSSRILDLTNGISTVTDKSYSFASAFFKNINIFGFSTLNAWSYFIASCSISLIIIILSKNSKISLNNMFFIIASCTLLNIYVFNIGKDFIQFLIFLIIFAILKCNKISNKLKLILSSLVLLAEAFVFRVYYAIMAMIMITIYCIYEKMIKNKIINKKTVFKIIVLALLFFFIEVFVVQLISDDNYNAILNARYIANFSRESSPDAITIINDLLGRNSNFIIFILNYLINFIRMIFPIELLTKGIKYVAFIFYQLFITFSIFKTSTKLTERNIMWLITVLSFIMISVIFEPDFGSFIRHESTMFLILFEMSKLNEEYKEE